MYYINSLEIFIIVFFLDFIFNDFNFLCSFNFFFFYLTISLMAYLIIVKRLWRFEFHLWRLLWMQIFLFCHWLSNFLFVFCIWCIRLSGFFRNSWVPLTLLLISFLRRNILRTHLMIYRIIFLYLIFNSILLFFFRLKFSKFEVFLIKIIWKFRTFILFFSLVLQWLLFCFRKIIFIVFLVRNLLTFIFFSIYLYWFSQRRK